MFKEKLYLFSKIYFKNIFVALKILIFIIFLKMSLKRPLKSKKKLKIFNKFHHTLQEYNDLF